MKIFQARKYYEFTFESNKIELFKINFLKEFVSLNGEPISKKITLKGTEHFLKVNDTEILIQTKKDYFKTRGFKLNLFVNRKLISSQKLSRK